MQQEHFLNDTLGKRAVVEILGFLLLFGWHTVAHLRFEGWPQGGWGEGITSPSKRIDTSI